MEEARPDTRTENNQTRTRGAGTGGQTDTRRGQVDRETPGVSNRTRGCKGQADMEEVQPDTRTENSQTRTRGVETGRQTDTRRGQADTDMWRGNGRTDRHQE